MILFYCLGVGTFLLGLLIGVVLTAAKNQDLEDSLSDQGQKLSDIESIVGQLIEANNSNAKALRQTSERLQTWIEIQRAESPLN